MRGVIIAILLPALVALLVAACGGSEDNAPPLVRDPSPTLAPRMTPTPTQLPATPTAAPSPTQTSPTPEPTPRPPTPTPAPPTLTPVPPTPAPPTPTPTPPELPAEYVVKPGDTLGEIADEFGITVDAIAVANQIANPDIIQAGETLTIPEPGTVPTPTPPPTPEPTVPATPGLLAVVDKQQGLPADYVPPNLVTLSAQWAAPGASAPVLRDVAAAALMQMLEAARAQGYDLRVSSSYRSYQQQAEAHAYWVNKLGEQQADMVSAEAGHSEHQLGTVADITSAAVGWQLVQSFGDTAGGIWLAGHAHEYGFALSYPPGEQATTGYLYEPWHFRYIGPEHAQAWANSGLTLVEYLKGLN